MLPPCDVLSVPSPDCRGGGGGCWVCRVGVHMSESKLSERKLSALPVVCNAPCRVVGSWAAAVGINRSSDDP